MTYTDHPLAGIFLSVDLERFAQGKCLTSNAPADSRIVCLMTGRGFESDPWILHLREWFLQAASHGTEVAAHYKQRLRSGVGSIKAFYQPVGALRAVYFFERQQGSRLAYVPVDPIGSQRTPEFEISSEEVTVLVEVKSIGDHPWAEGGGFGENGAPLPCPRRSRRTPSSNSATRATSTAISACWRSSISLSALLCWPAPVSPHSPISAFSTCILINSETLGVNYVLPVQ